MAELLNQAEILLDTDNPIATPLSLNKKSLGFSYLLIGIAERQAKSVSKLHKVLDTLEEGLFNPVTLQTLEFNEKLELHKYANSLVNTVSESVTKIKSKIDWNELDIELIKITQSENLPSNIDRLEIKKSEVNAIDLLKEMGQKLRDES